MHEFLIVILPRVRHFSESCFPKAICPVMRAGGATLQSLDWGTRHLHDCGASVHCGFAAVPKTPSWAIFVHDSEVMENDIAFHFPDDLS